MSVLLCWMISSRSSWHRVCYITLPQHFPPSCMPVSVHAGSSAGFSRIWCHVVRVSVERAESTQRGGSFIKIVLTSLLDSFSTLTWRPTSWQRTPISPTNSSPRYVTLRTDKHVFHVFIKSHFRSSFTLFCSVLYSITMRGFYVRIHIQAVFLSSAVHVRVSRCPVDLPDGTRRGTARIIKHLVVLYKQNVYFVSLPVCSFGFRLSGSLMRWTANWQSSYASWPSRLFTSVLHAAL